MEKTKVYCRKCKLETNHEIMFQHIKGWDDEKSGFYENEYYRVCECLGCETVCFVYEYENPDMWYVDENGDGVPIEHKTVYPESRKDSATRYEIKNFSYVPEELENLYLQVVENYRMGYYILASVGIRIIIEGLCKKLGIISGYVIDKNTNLPITIKKGEKAGQIALRKNLEGKINGLESSGILTKSQVEILHSIRDTGNESAHDLEIPSKTSVRKAIEIIEFTFTSIYELKKYAKITPKRMLKLQEATKVD